MKTRVYIIALLSVVTVVVNAQTYKNTYTPSGQQEQVAIQSQQIMHANVHEGTIYEPFSNTTPSEQSVVGASYTSQSGPRRSKENPSDPGVTDDTSSPLGEPWVLAVFALAFGGIVFLRRRREAKG